MLRPTPRPEAVATPLVYGDAPPTALRSWTSSRVATVHPSSISPTTFSSGDGGVVEELLAELVPAVRHLDLLDLDARLLDLHDEAGDAAVLGDVPVGAGQAQGVVGPERARAPDLRAVQHEDVAVAGGPGDQAGQVGPAGGLGEELHPELLAGQDLGDVALLLLLGAEVEQGGGEDGERRGVEDDRHLVGERLRGEGLLVGPAQALAPVLDREAHAGEAPVEQRALELAGPRGVLVLDHELVVLDPLGQARHVVGQPRPGPEAERLDVLCGGAIGHDVSYSPARAAIRSRWSAGVPNRARSWTTRRR